MPQLRIENGEPNREPNIAGRIAARRQTLGNINLYLAEWRGHNEQAAFYHQIQTTGKTAAIRNSRAVKARKHRADAKEAWRGVTDWAEILTHHGMVELSKEILDAAIKEGEMMGWVFGDEGHGNGGSAA